MANKQNPILAAFEAKKEAEFRQRRATHEEINMLSLIIAADDEMESFVESGEMDIGNLLFRYIEVKMQMAKDIVKDAEADPTLVYTKADIARRVKSVLSEEDWEQYKELFPLLRDYW